MFAQWFAVLFVKLIAIVGLSVSLTVVPVSSMDSSATDVLKTLATSTLAESQHALQSTSSTPEKPATAESDLPAGSTWFVTLPLGDSKYVTAGPKKGYIYLCHVGGTGGGAQNAGTWIDQTTHTWNPSEKLHVSGSVSWPNATISIKMSGTNRIITTNDLPSTHTSGIFPISSSDPASQFDRNPNAIQPQSFMFTLPAYPTIAAKPGCIYGEVGIMTNGVVLFDGFDAENRDAAAWEVQDRCDAHPQVTGAYHYHSLSSCIKNISVDSVIGYAFDGFPITGPKLPNGNYLHTADLDECHGLVSNVSLDGTTVKTYHYVMTQDFPYSVSCFKGKSTVTGPLGNKSATPQKPVSSGTPPGGTGVTQPNGTMPPAGSSQMPPGGGPPQEAIDACVEKQAHDECSFVSPMGDTITGICDTPPSSSMACVPR